MFSLLSSLSTTEKIEIFSILASTIVSIVSISIALATLKQNYKVTQEANKANIIFYVTKEKSCLNHYLVIKNFGKSSGQLINLSIDPPLSYEKSNFNCNLKPITEFRNVFLAPNQFVKSYFNFKNYPDKIFNVVIKYKTLGNIYIEKYTIDLSYQDNVISSSKSIKDELGALIAIKDSILEVSDKLY